MVEWLKSIMDLEFWTSVLEQIRSFGIIAGIGLPLLEAFFPPFPLVVFVTVNVLAFGFWTGYFYSWLGSCIGSIIVYLLIKKYGQKSFQRRVESRKIGNIFNWIKEKGFIPIFLLLTFPFTPSIIVCGLAALAGTSNKEYFSALILGKLVMIFSLSYIGVNVKSFVQQPVKSILLIAATLSISLIGKYVLQRFEKNRTTKQEKSERQIKVS